MNSQAPSSSSPTRNRSLDEGGSGTAASSSVSYTHFKQKLVSVPLILFGLRLPGSIMTVRSVIEIESFYVDSCPKVMFKACTLERTMMRLNAQDETATLLVIQEHLHKLSHSYSKLSHVFVVDYVRFGCGSTVTLTRTHWASR